MHLYFGIYCVRCSSNICRKYDISTQRTDTVIHSQVRLCMTTIREFIIPSINLFLRHSSPRRCAPRVVAMGNARLVYIRASLAKRYVRATATRYAKPIPTDADCGAHRTLAQ